MCNFAQNLPKFHHSFEKFQLMTKVKSQNHDLKLSQNDEMIGFFLSHTPHAAPVSVFLDVVWFGLGETSSLPGGFYIWGGDAYMHKCMYTCIILYAYTCKTKMNSVQE